MNVILENFLKFHEVLTLDAGELSHIRNIYNFFYRKQMV